MNPLRSCILISFLALTILTTRHAWSQTPADPYAGSEGSLETARNVAREAMAHYQAGRYSEAADGFQKADVLYAAPQYRIYRARALAKLGKLASAARAYDRAMTMPMPSGAPASFAEAQRAAAAELADLRKRVPTIRVVTTGAPVEAVTVTLDGAKVPRASWGRLEVDPGSHTIIASASGYQSISRKLDMVEGQIETIDLAVKPVPQPARPRVLSPVNPIQDAPVVPPASTHRGPRQGLLIAGGTLTGAALIAGTMLAVASTGKAHTAGELLKQVSMCPPYDASDLSGTCLGIVNARKAAAGLGDGAITAFIGAGVVGSATLIYGLSSRRRSQQTAHVSPTIGGFVVEGVF